MKVPCRWPGLRPAAALAVSAAACLLSAARAAEPLRVLIDASTEMPWAQRQGDAIIGGIHHDLAQALAQRLGREARFVPLPRKRLAQALAQGQGDILCGTRPDWLPGPFDWSRATLPDAELVVSRAEARRPREVADLAGVPIGTISGFVYPEIEQALGASFVRSDAPNAAANLRKLKLARMQHATFNQQFIDYQRRQGQLSEPLHPYLVLSSYQLKCALSRRAPMRLAEVDIALQSLVADGSLRALLVRYR